MVMKEAKEVLIKKMLLAIGEDPNREGLKDTPKRVVKMWDEIFGGYNEKNVPVITTFKNGSDGIIYDQMIFDTGDFYSHFPLYNTKSHFQRGSMDKGPLSADMALLQET